MRGLGDVKGSGKRPTYRGGSVAVFVECEKGWVAVRGYNSVQVYDNDDKKINNKKKINDNKKINNNKKK